MILGIIILFGTLPSLNLIYNDVIYFGCQNF